MSCTIEGGKFESKVWAGGEVHVQITDLPPTDKIKVKAILQNSQDIMEMLLLCEALKRRDCEIWLEIPYVPYARQDRVCNAGEPFSLKIMANLINSIGAVQVLIEDPHSLVTPALINNCATRHPCHYTALKKFSSGKTLVCPDAGAEKRVAEFKLPYVMATKVRDPQTGVIIKTTLCGDVKGKDCIVIDDICDGGRTFIALAEVLKAEGAGELSLYVTHGIFSQGSERLKKFYHHIYCLDYVTGNIKEM